MGIKENVNKIMSFFKFTYLIMLFKKEKETFPLNLKDLEKRKFLTKI